MRFFSNYPITEYRYNNPEEVYAIELSDEETTEINNVFTTLDAFTKKYSPYRYYMVEYGNGYNEEAATVYNFLQEHERNPAIFKFFVTNQNAGIYTPTAETVLKWRKKRTQ